MMNLAEYRRKGTRLADYLPWAALVAPGVVQKQGWQPAAARPGFAVPISTARSRRNLWLWRGASTTPFAASGPAGRSSSRRSGSRPPIIPTAAFPDPASALLDAERRAGFAEQGAHFQSDYLLTFLYLPPAEEAARAETWLYEGRDKTGHRMRARCCVASLTAPTGCWRSSTASCPNAAGWMIARR